MCLMLFIESLFPAQVLDDERDLSDRDTDLEDSGELPGGSWREEEDDDEEKEEDEGSVGVESACRQGVCHLLAPPLERSGRGTPVSVDSIPLEIGRAHV